MQFDPYIAAIRYGVGLSPRFAPPLDRAEMLADLAGPDVMAQTYKVPIYPQAAPSILAFQEALRARKAAEGTDGYEAARAYQHSLIELSRAQRASHFQMDILRRIEAPFGFRERLTAFWADHFTVIARGGSQRHLVSPYIEQAIRPHISGRFVDMLRAAVTHPMMQLYLDQVRSIGPGSRIGLRQGRGLNENLAREMLELHTVGVDGGYSQTDVRELAELLSGLTYRTVDGVVYDPARAEPGSETILGITYSDASERAVIDTALEDLARHPATARHLSKKLAAHFVADTPATELIEAMTAAYMRSGGDLFAVYSAMLDHPAAWSGVSAKVRPPLDFITAGMRALEVTARDINALAPRKFRSLTERPVRVMGQPWQSPPGPDGWADRAEDWIIPQTMAGRISWAMIAPTGLKASLPDPRDVLTAAFGPEPDPAVAFAANSAETARDGIGVIFASAAFNRR